MDEEEAYEQSIRLNTIESYNKYLKKYPAGEYRDKIEGIKHDLSDTIAYQDAVEENTIEAFEIYLRRKKPQKFSKEANEKILYLKEEERWSTAKKRQHISFI